MYQRQQQALEFGQQALDGRVVEVALVKRQVQAQVITRVTHRRQREVGVGTARVGAGVQVLGVIEHGGFNRRILEHEQAVEQRLALGQLAARLDRHQRQVFVLAQFHVALQQALQPLAYAATLTRRGQLHAQGHAVDEQADGALHLRHAHRAPGHGYAKGHVAVAAVARQHQGPGRLGESVDGELMGLGQLAQTHAIIHLKAGITIADDHAATGVVMAQRAVARDGCGTFEAGQVGLPPGACVVQALALQPTDVIAVTRRHRQLGLTAFAKGLVDFEEIVHQQRAAPGIDKDVVVAHHEPVAFIGHAHQAQVERCLAEQGKAGLALLLVQGLQALLLGIVGKAAPVLVVHRQVARLVDDLQHRLAAVPAERGAQRFVARHHGLPGLGETLGVERAVDAVAVLHVVQASARLQQGVQQHAFLHRRQRVNVLDLRGRDRQCVDLLLSQVRQREVRWGEAAIAIGQTMRDQRQQLLTIALSQTRDSLLVVALGAEGPAQLQSTAIHLAIDAQPVGQRRIEIMRQPGRGFQGLEQGRTVELLVELAQVVEGDARLRQGRHLLAPGGIRQVAQYAVAQALVRYMAQLFLDALDRTGPRRVVFTWQRTQAQWVGIGEPADAAGQVHVFEQPVTAMAFELHQHFFIAAPAAQGPRQCGQQQVVDLGVVSRRGQLQQLSGLLHVQADGQGLSVAMQIAALRMVARQFATHTAQLALPPGQFVTQRIAAGVADQARGPVADGVGLGRQRLATVQRLQVFQQHPPGHAINHQMMNRQQQPLGALPVTHQQGAQQRPLLQVQAALHVGVECLTIIEIGDSGAPQQLLGARLRVLRLPAALGVAEAQAQAVMVLHQRSQCLFKGGLNQGLAHLQQHGLVPVLRLWHVTVKEPVLDRRQPGLALAQALLDRARGFAELNHSCQGLDGLMLEQVAWGELQAGLPGAADHLDRQDRVAAQFEEVVLHPNLGNVQHVAPDLRQLCFHRAARGLVLLPRLLKIRQR